MRSLRMKLVMIMVILILALMSVVGAFLINKFDLFGARLVRANFRLEVQRYCRSRDRILPPDIPRQIGISSWCSC